jgi:hypothetical protein
MHGSKDDEDIEREGERRENENVSLHECTHIHLVMVPDDGNFAQNFE